MQSTVFYAGVGYMLYSKYQQMQLTTIVAVEAAEQEQNELNRPDPNLPSRLIQKAKKTIDSGTGEYNEVNTDLDSRQKNEIATEFAAREAIKPAFEAGPQPEGVYLDLKNRW